MGITYEKQQKIICFIGWKSPLHINQGDSRYFLQFFELERSKSGIHRVKSFLKGFERLLGSRLSSFSLKIQILYYNQVFSHIKSTNLKYWQRKNQKLQIFIEKSTHPTSRIHKFSSQKSKQNLSSFIMNFHKTGR